MPLGGPSSPAETIDEPSDTHRYTMPVPVRLLPRSLDVNVSVLPPAALALKREIEERAAKMSQPPKGKQGHFWFITFGTHRYDDRRESLATSARSCDGGLMFDRVISYNESYITALPDYKVLIKPLLKSWPRGWGLWSFKSVLALHTLESMADGDLLMYMDADMKLDCRLGRGNVLRAWASYIDGADNPLDVVAFTNGNDTTITGTSQNTAGSWLLRKSPGSLALLQRWREAFLPHNWNIVSDNRSVVPNMRGFKEHRHDASVFSILRKQYAGSALLTGTQMEPWSPIQHTGMKRPRWRLR